MRIKFQAPVAVRRPLTALRRRATAILRAEATGTRWQLPITARRACLGRCVAIKSAFQPSDNLSILRRSHIIMTDALARRSSKHKQHRLQIDFLATSAILTSERIRRSDEQTKPTVRCVGQYTIATLSQSSSENSATQGIRRTLCS